MQEKRIRLCRECASRSTADSIGPSSGQQSCNCTKQPQQKSSSLNRMEPCRKTLWSRIVRPYGTVSKNLMEPYRKTLWRRFTRPYGAVSQDLMEPCHKTLWNRIAKNLMEPYRKSRRSRTVLHRSGESSCTSERKRQVLAFLA